MQILRDTRGFTMLESLIAVVIFGIVGIALFQVLETSRTTIDDQSSLIEAQQNARIALNTVAHDFRHVSYGKDATQPSIYYADTDSVVFVADLFQDIAGAEVISYYLSNAGDPDTQNPNDTILMKTVTDTAGNVLLDAPQSYGIGNSGFQVRYFNGNSLELTAPVAQPELIGEVQVNVAGVSPRPRMDGSYETVNLSTTIYPRNLPLTPARSRPRPPGPNGVSAPDCQSVTLNWTTPVENTDATALDFNDISHFNVYLGTNPSAMALNARLARTINTWTITGLTSGSVYYMHVTCVSRAGVESYPWETTSDLTSGFTPIAPDNVVANVMLGTATLTWDPVTQFTDSSTITVDVAYEVHRANVPSFPLSPATLLDTTDPSVTTFVDSTLATCDVVYYSVAAVACSNVGAGSDDISAITPAPPSCVASVDPTLGTADGEVDVSWTGPFTRINGTTLDPADVDHYTVVYDTIPNGTADSLVVAGGGALNGLLTGLLPCTTYYINVRATDSCLSTGELCPSNEAVISTASPCTPEAPSPVAGLTGSVGSNQVNLTWPANTIDCDLKGYRIYYGYTPGGPYSGVGAIQGNSPVEVLADDVTSGANCSFTLEGMDMCSNIYLMVTAIDRCAPENESTASNEVTAGTSCANCDIAMTCTQMSAIAPSYNDVVYSVFTTAGDQTVSKIRPTFSGGAELTALSVDGNVVWTGAAESGDNMIVSPFVISSTSESRGHYVVAQFDSNMKNASLTFDFFTDGLPCSVSGDAKGSLLVDDFDDGNYNGWTVNSGTWFVDGSGVLRQTTNTFSTSQWIYTSFVNWSNDFVFEADLRLDVGTFCIMQFNRYASGYRYLGFLWNGTQAHFAEMTPGYADLMGVGYNFPYGEWRRTRVEKEGAVYRMYADCDLLLEMSIFPVPPGGRFGFGSYTAEVAFDDVLITER